MPHFLNKGIPEVYYRDGAGGEAEGQGDALAADQGEHPRGQGHYQQQQLHNGSDFRHNILCKQDAIILFR